MVTAPRRQGGCCCSCCGGSVLVPTGGMLAPVCRRAGRIGISLIIRLAPSSRLCGSNHLRAACSSRLSSSESAAGRRAQGRLLAASRWRPRRYLASWGLRLRRGCSASCLTRRSGARDLRYRYSMRSLSWTSLSCPAAAAMTIRRGGDWVTARERAPPPPVAASRPARCGGHGAP
jgi:hypothetical protein